MVHKNPTSSSTRRSSTSTTLRLKRKRARQIQEDLLLVNFAVVHKDLSVELLTTLTYLTSALRRLVAEGES